MHYKLKKHTKHTHNSLHVCATYFLLCYYMRVRTQKKKKKKTIFYYFGAIVIKKDIFWKVFYN